VRVAIDVRKLHDFGIGTYVRNLVSELARQDDDAEYVLLCTPADREPLAALGPRFQPHVVRAGNYSVREQFVLPWAVATSGVDLYHAPHYVVPPLTPSRFLVTIHDCIHLRFPQYLPNPGAFYYARAMMSLAARRSRRVLSVSEESNDDILYYLGIPDEKVEVIYNALDPRLAGEPTPEDVVHVRERFQLDKPFILYTGNIKPHKNVDRLIDAFAILRQNRTDDVKLLIIGDEASKYPNLRRLVHRHQLHHHVRFLGFVPDATLAVLYRLASVFVFPSLYEGFGLPPLEAMAAGTPVVTSNISSLPEVVGDAALLIDPMDANAIAEAMGRILNDPALRADLVRRGRERVKAFSWERSVARIRQVYGELARTTAHA
jgi:glycosyltransferase involved in cell wall biosynthesis